MWAGVAKATLFPGQGGGALLHIIVGVPKVATNANVRKNHTRDQRRQKAFGTHMWIPDQIRSPLGYQNGGIISDARKPCGCFERIFWGLVLGI